MSDGDVCRIISFDKRGAHAKKGTAARQFLFYLIHLSVYFLKKSGILIVCSFTLLDGVLGCSVGMVPP